MSQLAAVPYEPGTSELVEALDEAVASARGDEAITRAVRDALVDLIGRNAVALPAHLLRPAKDSYARRLIHRSPTQGWVAIAMIWGPQQGTALHDHAGLWCVEGVLDGQIEVTQYDLVEREGTRCRFVRQGSELAGVGSAGRLIPPYDYHTIANALPDRPSVTIHVYGGDMDHCNIYQPSADGWYDEVVRLLRLTED
jgi:3-mercaptopropionate dioxygenase